MEQDCTAEDPNLDVSPELSCCLALDPDLAASADLGCGLAVGFLLDFRISLVLLCAFLFQH